MLFVFVLFIIDKLKYFLALKQLLKGFKVKHWYTHGMERGTNDKEQKEI